MVLALAATALVALALLSDLILPRLDTLLAQHKARRRRIPTTPYDPGRERRAEQRARELLRSCVGEEEWGMYRDLGFIRVWGSQTETPAGGADGVPYAYLVYPHKPLIAYLPQTNRLLAEYCVEFPDDTRPYGSARLPDSDDVLAKWMALTGDERRLVSTANMHLPGRQHDPRRIARDLWRLAQWERAWMRAVRPQGESRIDAAG